MRMLLSYVVRRAKRNREGMVSFEFLFAFFFILIAFLIIFSLEMLVIIRIAESFDTWRVARVSSIIGWNCTVQERNQMDLSKKKESKPADIGEAIEHIGEDIGRVKIEHMRFGDAIASSLESVFNLSLLENSNPELSQKPPVDIIIRYNAPVFRHYLKLDKEYLYWNSPGPPERVEEHQDVIKTGRDDGCN